VKRRKPIPELGHVAKPAAVPAFVECAACGETRLKIHPWRKPCSSSAVATVGKARAA